MEQYDRAPVHSVRKVNLIIVSKYHSVGERKFSILSQSPMQVNIAETATKKKKRKRIFIDRFISFVNSHLPHMSKSLYYQLIMHHKLWYIYRYHKILLAKVSNGNSLITNKKILFPPAYLTSTKLMISKHLPAPKLQQHKPKTLI